VTGANGFLGLSVREHLLLSGNGVVGAMRYNSRPVTSLVNVGVGDLDRIANWEALLTGCDVVVHLAGRAHVLAESSNDPLREVREVNTLGSLSLAK